MADKSFTKQQVATLAHHVMDRLDLTSTEAAGMCRTMCTSAKARMVEGAGLPRRLNYCPDLWHLVRGHLLAHAEQVEVRADEVRVGDAWLSGDLVTYLESTPNGRAVVIDSETHHGIGARTYFDAGRLMLRNDSRVWVVRH